MGEKEAEGFLCYLQNKERFTCAADLVTEFHNEERWEKFSFTGDEETLITLAEMALLEVKDWDSKSCDKT
jgi:hypothetical protein